MIDIKTLNKLNFNKILNRLKEYASSSLTKEKIDEILPLSNIEEINRLQDENEEALYLMDHYGRPNIFGIRAFHEELHHVSIGGSMEMGSLLDLADMLRSVRDFLDYYNVNEEEERNHRHIGKYAGRLTDLSSLERKISNIILSENEISDDASPNLKRIRRNILRTSQGIRDKLQKIVKNSTDSKLQDNIVTVREGRYVVPVKAANKNNFHGVVHGQSASGATVYIEPMVIVELNNELRILENEEIEEIHKILKELSIEVYNYSNEIIENTEMLLELDLIFCRGKLALDMEATRPRFSTDGRIHIKQARHPEIPKNEVVPIDLELDPSIHTLIITGPNTGGKTVSLKTVALMSLLAQSGLFIPCKPGSVIEVYQNIYADIGDEQSIEQSLSTFSAHMTNIVRILKDMEPNSLVLLDELGAGTDPTEGAALAIAILEELRNSPVRTMATTHYSQLKYYALQTEGVINGAVEFDVETLRPTYKLEVGLPGKSNAFQISEKLGLQENIIQQARAFIDDENESFEDILARIEKNKKELEIQNTRKREELEKIEQLKLSLNHEANRLEKEKERIIQDAKDEAYLILEEAKEQSQNLMKELRFQQSSSVDHQKLNQLETKMNDSLKKLGKKEKLLKTNTSKKKEKLSLGDDVLILGIDQVGEVLSLPDKKGDFQVQVGILKMNVNKKNIKRIDDNKTQESKTQIKNIIQKKSKSTVSAEIDLRGLNVEEAIVDIDQYLDEAYLHGHKEVFLIHGKGTGALRKGIQNYLRRQKHVGSYRDGTFAEGGMGVTVVELK